MPATRQSITATLKHVRHPRRTPQIDETSHDLLATELSGKTADTRGTAERPGHTERSNGLRSGTRINANTTRTQNSRHRREETQ